MKRSKIYHFIVYFFQILSFVLVLSQLGCKAKKITTDEYIKPAKPVATSPSDNSNYEAIERVWFKKIAGEYMVNESSTKFKANIRLVKDSLIIVSISSNSGIEGLRVVIKPDSVLIQNRLKARYYFDKISNLPEGRVKLWNFSLIQDILLMNAEGIFSVDQTSPKYESTEIENKLCYLNNDADLETFKFNNRFVHRETCFDKVTGLIKSGSASYSEWKEDIFVEYLNYFVFHATYLPGSVEIKSKFRDSVTILKVEMDKIDLNNYFPTRVNISSKYKRVFAPDEI